MSNRFGKSVSKAPAISVDAIKEAAAEPQMTPPTPRPKSREGKKAITVWVEPEALRQLHELTIREDSNVNALVREGINMLFADRNLSRIA